MTRLADLTNLDCIGVPVWQSVRPWSRALSVHQGKGLTRETARLGAVMEAIECHHAETWRAGYRGPRSVASWSALPPRHRAALADDFAQMRGGFAGDRAVEWVSVEPIDGDAWFYVPARFVSLDCTDRNDTDIAMSSTGQAAHFSMEKATLAGLLELIERDATAEWLARAPLGRIVCEIDKTSIPIPEFASIAARLADRRIGCRVYCLPTVIPVPTYAVELASIGPFELPHQRTWGSACALTAESALLAALLEALQSRCTEIAGSRDTTPLNDERIYAGQLIGTLSFPRAPGMRGRRFSASSAGPCDLTGVITAVRSAGYRVGRLRLSPEHSDAVTVKAFVPGFAHEARRRRAA